MPIIFYFLFFLWEICSPTQQPSTLSRMPSKYKECKTCRATKSLSDFNTNGRYKGKQKYKPACKVCENMEKRARHNGWISNYFGGIVCKDCGFEGHPVQYDCHHVKPENKSFNISEAMSSNCSKEKLVTELEKCVLLCSNCHRLRHATY